MSMFWKEIELSRVDGELNWVWEMVDTLTRKRNKSEQDQKELEDLTKLAVELECQRRLDRFDLCERPDSMGGFGIF
jgi:hypothetical protein